MLLELVVGVEAEEVMVVQVDQELLDKVLLEPLLELLHKKVVEVVELQLQLQL